MTAENGRDHDPAACQDGDGCRPCKAVEQQQELKRLAQTRRVTPAAKRSALEVLSRQTRELGLGLAALLVVLALGGCVAPEAIEQARTEAAACHGLAVEPSNPPAVRSVGARQELAWDQQHVTLTGDHVPGRETWTPIPAEFLPAPAAPTVPR